MLIALYHDYFESLAIRHSVIRHDPNAAAGKSRGRNAFGLYNADDVLRNRFRNDIVYPALMVEMYECSFNGTIYDPKASWRGAFSIFMQGDEKARQPEKDALAVAEKVMWEVLVKMYRDHYGPDAGRCTSPFRHIDIGGGNIMPFGPIWDQVYGWRYEFSFRPRLTFALDQPLPDGTFTTA